jgi:hypothetical protein
MTSAHPWDDMKVATSGHLALVLGGDETSFTGDLLHLIGRADPDNLRRLTLAFPREVALWQLWQRLGPPAPTFRQMHAFADAYDQRYSVETDPSEAQRVRHDIEHERRT